MALQFFLKCGFQELAYCGHPSVFFSDQRQEAFAAQVARWNRRAHVYAPALPIFAPFFDHKAVECRDENCYCEF